MKEIRNIAEKNVCFGELNYEFLTKETKNEALTMLMLMETKRSGDVKTRGYADGGLQKVHKSREYFLSLNPDFHALKCARRNCQRKKRCSSCVSSWFLHGFFL